MTEEKPDVHAGLDKMNGYSISDFKDFEKKWKLVTVRFRKDTDEMRWTFANDLAWKTLESGSIQYPNGAIFSKIGIRTSPDSQFQSSAVPQGARRYQFMIRDTEKFKNTGGWGYVIFDVNGKTFSEDPKIVEQSCYACHKLVDNRGQVFSQPFQIAPFTKIAFLSEGKGFKTISFEWRSRKSLPQAIVQILPAKIQKIRVVSNEEISKNLFQGALDEIKPSLERESFESTSPVAIISPDGLRYSIVMPAKMAGCKKESSFKSVMTILNQKEKTLTNTYCNP